MYATCFSSYFSRIFSFSSFYIMLFNSLLIINNKFHSKFFYLEMPINSAKKQRGESTFRIKMRVSLFNLPIAYLFKFFICFFYLTSKAVCQISGENLIINGNFSMPLVLSRTQSFSKSILGWNCTKLCEIKNCMMGMKYWLPQNKIDSNCIGQIIDLNSNSFNEIVTQTLLLQSGSYRLNFNYYLPIQRATLKALRVSFNNETLLDFRPHVDASFDVFQYEAVVQAEEGSNVLSFENLGYSSDGMGFKINNVSLYRQIDIIFQEVVNSCMVHSSVGNKFPGARVVIRNVLSFLINFDRLQLYIYHNRTYGYNMQNFLLSVNNLLNTKGQTPKDILSIINQNEIKAENAFIQSLDYKQNYTSYASFSEDYRFINFFDNINQTIIYFLPFVFLTFITLNFFFRLLFNKRISLIFRKFDFWGIILLMTFDGNVESLTFFFLAQFKLFFSQCFRHKLLNMFIICLFFLLIFAVFGFYLWAHYYYGKKFKYILDERKPNAFNIFGGMLDRGIVCFIFGVVHQMLITTPDLQICILSLVQLSWIIKKVIFICKKQSNEKWMVVISILNGICRLSFHVTIWLYSKREEMRLYINQKIHKYLILMLLGISLLELLVGLSYSFHSLCKFNSKQNTSKIQPKCSKVQEKKIEIKQTQMRIVEKMPKQKIEYFNQSDMPNYEQIRFLKITLHRRINKTVLMKGNTRWNTRLRNRERL